MKPFLVNELITVAVISVVGTHAQPAWYWQNPKPTGNPMKAVHFVTTDVGTALGQWGTILRTVDGGKDPPSHGQYTNWIGLRGSRHFVNPASLVAFLHSQDKARRARLIGICVKCPF